MTRKRVAVLISGRGSNMASLLAAAARPDYPAEVVAVIANRPDAAGLGHAAAAGVTTSVVDHKRYIDRPAFETALTERLEAAGVDLICHAGFMRIVTARYVDRWRDRILNIHPSLLPAFPGLDTHARALAAGVKVHGCTVHFVREKVDDGPIVAQGVVPVLPDDTPDSLATRVVAVEHRLYPHALALVASGRAKVVGDRVNVNGVAATSDAVLLSPTL
jgi:phosphoribosylglycinamide formyltransferase-1